MILYYRNVLITCIKIQPFCTLRTPFDIVCNLLFSYGSHPKRPLQKSMVLQICLYLEPQGVPRHDCGFQLNFDDGQNRIYPRACRPWQKQTTINKSTNKCTRQTSSPPARPPERGVRGAAAPRKFPGLFPVGCRMEDAAKAIRWSGLLSSLSNYRLHAAEIWFSLDVKKHRLLIERSRPG